MWRDLLWPSMCGLALFLTTLRPQNTIKDIMKKAHTGTNPLAKRVVAGNCTLADKEELLRLYEDLAKTRPPKGDADAWMARTAALVDAAKDVVAGKDKAEKVLGKAMACEGCHQAHKPK